MSIPQGLNNSSLLRRLGGGGRGRGEGGGGGHIEGKGTKVSKLELETKKRKRKREEEVEVEDSNLYRGSNDCVSKSLVKPNESPWFAVTNAISGPDYFKDEDNMKAVFNLKDEISQLQSPIQLSKILNQASKASNDLLIEIIRNWGDDNLSRMLYTVIDKVGKLFRGKVENGSIEISLIFNALSKIKDNGKKVGEFFDIINDSNKWPNIINNAKFQEISNILNALSKIEDGGVKVKEFSDKIAPDKWPNILKNASPQAIALIFNALSKIEDNGKRVGEFYDKIENEWLEITLKVNAQDIRNILCALSKVDDDGQRACKFYDKIGANLLIEGANVRDLLVNIDALAKTKQGKNKLKEIYEKIPPELLKKMIEDTNLDNIRRILVSLSKSPEAGSFLGDLCKHNSWSSKTFDRSDGKSDFANVTKIIEALNSVKGNGVLLRNFYDITKKNYVKTGEELACKYNKQDIGNQDFLLDLHRLGINEAKIVTKLFLEDMKKKKKERFFIECGRGNHTKTELSGNIVKEVEELLVKELKDITSERSYGLIKVEKKKELGTPPTTVGVGGNNLGRRGVSAPAASR